ncbi:MAG: hypothetical protein GY795_30960 [Desulfobacterales bacterium]|nr:hypothetical protein [Desulfobacterales bacterium]
MKDSVNNNSETNGKLKIKVNKGFKRLGIVFGVINSISFLYFFLPIIFEDEFELSKIEYYDILLILGFLLIGCLLSFFSCYFICYVVGWSKIRYSELNKIRKIGVISGFIAAFIASGFIIMKRNNPLEFSTPILITSSFLTIYIVFFCIDWIYQGFRDNK